MQHQLHPLCAAQLYYSVKKPNLDQFDLADGLICQYLAALCAANYGRISK